MRDANKLPFQYAVGTQTNTDQPFQVTTMGDDGEQRDLTLNDLDAYTRWPYSDSQLFLAMMTAEIKFSPRCAKIVIRTSAFTCSTKTSKSSSSPPTVGAGSNTSTPLSTPQKKHNLDYDELDAL